MLNLLQFSLALIVMYSGLFIGMALAKIAKEELKPGKRYFLWMKNILLVLIFILPIILTKGSVWSILILITAITFTILHQKKKISVDLDLIYYTLFGILLALVSKNNYIFIIQGSLIFLYGLPVGSHIPEMKKRTIIVQTAMFFGLALFTNTAL